MGTAHLRIGAAVLGVAVAAYVFYGMVLDITRRGSGVDLLVVVEGLLLSAAVLAVWQLARTRRTAAVGLGVALVLVLTGLTGALASAEPFAASSLAWAVVVTLLVRLVVAGSGAASPPTRQRAGSGAARS
jgi:hypothetical protein